MVEMRWTNRAVGRAMHNFHLLFALADAQAKIVATSDAGESGAQRFVKDKFYELTPRVTFNHIPPGRYTFQFSLRDGDRAIQLPLRPVATGYYAIGEVEVISDP